MTALLEMDLNISIDAAAVDLLKGERGDILQLPCVMYLDCRTNLALQVRDLGNDVCFEIYLYFQRSTNLHIYYRLR